MLLQPLGTALRQHPRVSTARAPPRPTNEAAELLAPRRRRAGVGDLGAPCVELYDGLEAVIGYVDTHPLLLRAARAAARPALLLLLGAAEALGGGLCLGGLCGGGRGLKILEARLALLAGEAAVVQHGKLVPAGFAEGRRA